MRLTSRLPLAPTRRAPEPFYLFGAAPFKAIDSKWFQAAPSAVDHRLDATLSLCGLKIEVIPAPGHSMNQVALATSSSWAPIRTDAAINPGNSGGRS